MRLSLPAITFLASAVLFVAAIALAWHGATDLETAERVRGDAEVK